MASVPQKLIAAISSLPQEDRETVLAALSKSSVAADDPSSLPEPTADETYQRQLLAAGLICEIRLRRRDQDAFDRFRPVVISGEPLSETIIQERGWLNRLGMY